MDGEDSEHDHDPLLVGDGHDSTISSWQSLNPLVSRMSSPLPGYLSEQSETPQPAYCSTETLCYMVVQESENPNINPEALLKSSASSGSPSASSALLFDSQSPATSSVYSALDFQDGLDHGLYESPVGSPQASPI